MLKVSLLEDCKSQWGNKVPLLKSSNEKLLGDVV